MSRWEFMRKLEELLSDISPNEREEALQYYNDYFNDAGRENEQEVIDALGSPEQVAQIVKDGLLENDGQGEFTENGYTRKGSGIENKPAAYSPEKTIHEEKTDPGWDTSEGASYRRTDADAEDKEKPENGNQTSGSWDADSREPNDSSGEAKAEMPAWELVLIVIGCIFLLPVILSVAGAVLTAVISVIGTVVAVVFGLGIATLVLYVVAVALIIAGFSCIFASPAMGIGLLGGGCICGALGLLLMIAVAFLAGKGVPAICRWMGSLIKKISDRKRGKTI